MSKNGKFLAVASLAKSLLEPYHSKNIPVGIYRNELGNYVNGEPYDTSNLLEGIKLAKLVLHYQYVNAQFDPLYYGSLSYYEPLLDEFEMEVKNNGME